jgi:hypothetical protein
MGLHLSQEHIPVSQPVLPKIFLGEGQRKIKVAERESLLSRAARIGNKVLVGKTMHCIISNNRMPHAFNVDLILYYKFDHVPTGPYMSRSSSAIRPQSNDILYCFQTMFLESGPLHKSAETFRAIGQDVAEGGVALPPLVGDGVTLAEVLDLYYNVGHFNLWNPR